ncbi:MAG: SusC/RagA family TonB-linked outer membrane protein [Prolixibacteraceae bacterium]
MRKIALLLTLFAFVAIQVVCAQSKRITGTVSTADQTTLPGVSIVVKGTTSGTITDVDGKYSLNVSTDAKVLVFSFIGMETKNVEIGTSTVIDVVMKPDMFSMEEVIVTGYGTTTKEAQTGAATQIGTANLAETPVVSVDQVLSGKVAGLMVTTSGGQPGANSSIRIRGTSSINAGNEPLYVVDGIPVMTGDQSYASTTSNALFALNPSDIASITVLKDAAAASIYGSRAANGVILITTKSGKSGEAKIEFRANAGVNTLANDNNYWPMTSSQSLEYLRAAVVNSGGNPDNPAGVGSNTYLPNSLLQKEQTNWLQAGLRNGITQKYELNITAGTERISNYFSVAYENIEGIVIGNDYKKLNARVNSDFFVNSKVKVGTRIGLSNMHNDDVSTGGLSYLNPFFGSLNILPWTQLKNEDGSYNTSIPENSDVNPVYANQINQAWDQQLRLQSTAYMEYKPVKGITLKTNNSYEMTNGESRQYGTQDTGWTEDALYTYRYDYSLLTTSNTARYEHLFYDVHNLNLLVGQEAQLYRVSLLNGYSPGVSPDIPYPTTSTSSDDEVGYDESEWSMLSFFGIFDYNYNSKYYLKASIRMDGSSRFGANNKYGQFWAIGTSWNMHNESFLEDNVSWINIAKLRASYGVNGNNQIGNYDQYGVYGSLEYNGTSGMSPTQLGNPDLSWETNRTWNIGLDLTLMDRIDITLDAYERFTEDMLLDDQLSRTSGFSSIKRNVGQLKNVGQELAISYDAVKQGDLNFSFGLNIAHNRSEILDLAGEDEIGTYRVYKVGSTLYTFKLHDYAGVNPANGEALWFDENGALTNNYDNSREIYAGSPEPKFIGGGFLDFSWKGFALVSSFDWKAGHFADVMNEGRYLRSDGYNWIANQVNTSLDYWKQPGDITETPKPIVSNSSNSNAFTSTRFLEKGDYMRIKEVTLSYYLPSKLLSKAGGMKSLKLYASAYNLYTFHSLNAFDPERGTTGHAYGIYPTAKTFIGGIVVNF